MAISKTKAELKDVFNGPASLLYQSSAITVSGTTISGLAPQYDVPCKIDTLSFEQGEPSMEHYKVIGLASDWVSASEPGDITISFRVPTKSTEILQLAYGSDAVLTNLSPGTGDYSDFSGNGVILKNHKVQGTWAILNDAGDQLLIINNTALYASIVMDTDTKGVVALDFSGTIESDGSSPDVIFLRKSSSSS